MSKNQLTIEPEVCRTARLSRDPRFDGQFFVGVITTGIFCRPICPAVAPKESNVIYYPSAISASIAGYRPCLRCRPDSAPNSEEWLGHESILKTAITLINQGYLDDHSLLELAERLKVSDRYVRQLFTKHIGVAPKQFVKHRNCLFAKKLLHETNLGIQQVAFASGFNSIRNFNHAFKSICGKAPSSFRSTDTPKNDDLTLSLHYRPPLHWDQLINFLRARCISSIEKVVGNAYTRTFEFNDSYGEFTIEPIKGKNQLKLTLKLNQLDDLAPIVERIKQCFDLNSNPEFISQHLSKAIPFQLLSNGIRIPLVWSSFEAGIRAICGQQVSVKAAHNLVHQIVENLGQKKQQLILFPKPETISNCDFDFLKMPGRRKQTLRDFASWWLMHSEEDIESILSINGIGPWTMDYIKMRGIGDSDIWLNGDLGVQQALKQLNLSIDDNQVKPYRSYLTFQLWHLLQ